MWRQTPQALVGFIPRLHLPDPASRGAFLYRRFWTVWRRGEYSIVLTKACFMHRDFLELYTRRSPPAVIQHIDANRCARGVTQRALSVTQRALSVTQRARSVTQRALSVTQRALSVTQRARSVTQRALSVTQRALSITQRALSVTQRPLSVTQSAHRCAAHPSLPFTPRALG
jgi:hypothetical protein